jgi:hypothetical protein
MTPHWLTITTEAKRRSRARIKETRVRTVLCHHPDAVLVLTGEHGRRVLEQVAERWNSSGYTTSSSFTRCRADFPTEAARKSFTLSIS